MATPFPRAKSSPPYVETQRMKRIDYWAAHEFQVTLPVMLEHAGRLTSDLARARFGLKTGDRAALLAGSGGNGAGILASGRHLAHRGIEVEAILAEPSTKLGAEAKKQLAMFRKEGGSVPAEAASIALPEADLILDGLIGYGLRGAPRGRPRALIELANSAKAPRLALDLPSGLHPDSGEPSEPTLRAAATLALGLPKSGLSSPKAKPFAGEIYLADVGLPRALYEELDATPEGIFGEAGIVRL